MLTHDQSGRRRGPSLADRTDSASEQALAAYWTATVDAGRGGAPFILRNWPSRGPRSAVRRLPVVEARPSATPGGRAVHRVLATRESYGVPGRLLGTAILEVPEDGVEYVLGRRAQTLRRKIRSAERRGLKVRRIDEDAERRALVEVATTRSRTTPTRPTACRPPATTT